MAQLAEMEGRGREAATQVRSGTPALTLLGTAGNLIQKTDRNERVTIYVYRTWGALGERLRRELPQPAP